MPQRKVLPEKLTVPQLLIQFLVFCRTSGSLQFPPQPDSHPLN